MKEDLNWIVISIPMIRYNELKAKAHKYDELIKATSSYWDTCADDYQARCDEAREEQEV